MNKEDDGGPAFPPHCLHDGDGVLREVSCYGMQTGMSLRDYFAARIAAAFCTGPEGGVNPIAGQDTKWQQATARTAYEIADAMLVQRTA